MIHVGRRSHDLTCASQRLQITDNVVKVESVYTKSCITICFTTIIENVGL